VQKSCREIEDSRLHGKQQRARGATGSPETGDGGEASAWCDRDWDGSQR
jgi:hypothetical protein